MQNINGVEITSHRTIQHQQNEKRKVFTIMMQLNKKIEGAVSWHWTSRQIKNKTQETLTQNNALNQTKRALYALQNKGNKANASN